MVIDDTLIYPARRGRRPLSEAERRRILARDGFAWALVALIHILMFFALVISLQQSRERQGRRGSVEQIFDLSMFRQNRTVPLNYAPPEPDVDRDISAKPLTVIPPKTPVIEVAPPPASNTPGDVLNSVGQYLACGASIFEYLTTQQQARCLQQPWQGVIMPNGAIVLLGPPQATAPGPMQFTGAEAQRRQSQQAPNCPMMLNTPCLADMFNGVGGRN